MDFDQAGNNYCPGCAEPFSDGAMRCELCELQLNEETGVITLGLEKTFELQKNDILARIIKGAKAAQGTKDLIVFKERLDRLNKTMDESFRGRALERARKDGMKRLQSLVTELKQGESVTIFDDNAEQLTLSVISKQKSGIVVGKIEPITWGVNFSDAIDRRVIQLLTGIRTPKKGWFDGNLKNRLSNSSQMIHATPYNNASHSAELDRLISAAFNGWEPERLVYPDTQPYSEIVQTLCDTAPLGEDISALSAKVDSSGNVSYDHVVVFSGDKFIQPDRVVNISLKSNALNSGQSKLLFHLGNNENACKYYEIDLDIPPRGTKTASIMISRRSIATITVDGNGVKALKGTPDLLSKVRLKIPVIEVYIILDTIVNSDQEFDVRKNVVKKLIDAMEKQFSQFEITYHLYSYSCDTVPDYSPRPDHWPALFTYDNGKRSSIEKSLRTLKISGPGPHVFPGRLELVFQEMTKHHFDESNQYCMFIIGNRPASPHKDLRGMYGVRPSWVDLWKSIKPKFSVIQVIHDQFCYAQREIYQKFFKKHCDEFWFSVQPNNRIDDFQKENFESLLIKLFKNLSDFSDELVIPSVVVESE